MAKLYLPLLLLLSIAEAAAPYKCKSFVVPVKVSDIPTIEFPLNFNSSYESVAFTNAIIQRDAPAPQLAFAATPLTTTFNISVEYCRPAKQTAKSSTVQLLTHGLGFDKSYWDFRLTPQDTQYSWTHTALTSGYSTLAWDRLGCGLSSAPDPYNVIQGQVEVAVLAGLTTLLRTGKITAIPTPPTHVIHVGHSWGSEISNALVNLAPTLSDGLILTGFSGNLSFAGLFVAASTLRLARENQPSRFASRSSGYVTWPDKYANQFAFLEYPYFDPAVLEYAEAHKYPITVGELITQAALNWTAEAFKGPVLYYVGDKDLIFCGSNCTGLLGSTSTAFTRFEGSKDTEVYIQPNTGHGMNLHFNATKGYEYVMSWLGKNGF